MPKKTDREVISGLCELFTPSELDVLGAACLSHFSDEERSEGIASDAAARLANLFCGASAEAAGYGVSFREKLEEQRRRRERGL